VTLPYAGHALMAEHPDGVRIAIADFARRAFAPA
jgi:pimeloyl-ACP methyl ester carboxylesterase